MPVSVPVRTIEWLRFTPGNPRGEQMCQAFLGSAPVRVSDTYAGGADLLCLWGPGAPNRWPAMQQQLAAGGHVIAWDLAYWQRETKVRLSIDAAHPQAWVMRRTLPTSRLEADGIQVQSRWHPDGPVIVAGLGAKAKVQYGADVVERWEAQMIAACRAEGRTILYRRKNHQGDSHPSVPRIDGPSIDAVLTGASLVITWHSNVAVDAMRLGIPVVCRDGAAAAIAPSVPDFAGGGPFPIAEAVRRQFLANLAWFQWAPHEASACWAFLQEILG